MFSKQSLLSVSIVSASLVLSSVAFADPNETKSNSTAAAKTSSDGYGAPEVKITQLAGSAGMLLGSQGGWIINHHFIVGGAGYGLVSDVMLERSATKSIGFGYGGFRPGFIVGDRTDVLHLTGGVILGAAGVSVGDREGSGGVTWAVEPDVGVDVSVTQWLRIGLSGSYRFVGASEEAKLTFAQLSGPAGGIAAKVGSF